jgi:hypothetical protein
MHMCITTWKNVVICQWNLLEKWGWYSGAGVDGEKRWNETLLFLGDKTFNTVTTWRKPSMTLGLSSGRLEPPHKGSYLWFILLGILVPVMNNIILQLNKLYSKHIIPQLFYCLLPSKLFIITLSLWKYGIMMCCCTFLLILSLCSTLIVLNSPRCKNLQHGNP